MKINKILSDNQFGFKEDPSTSDAMYTLTAQIVNSLNNNKRDIAIFFDLAKAFDTVPHEELLCVLFRNEVRGQCWMSCLVTLVRGDSFQK